MKNSISSIKNGIIARPTISDENSNEVKSTNINVLLNRVKLDQKKESRKKNNIYSCYLIRFSYIWCINFLIISC